MKTKLTHLLTAFAFATITTASYAVSDSVTFGLQAAKAQAAAIKAAAPACKSSACCAKR